MSIGLTRVPASFLVLGAVFALCLLPFGQADAQQYLGNARQRCQGVVTVTTPGGSLQVRPFEARSADIGNAAVQWQCPDQPQPGQIQCPPGTNKVLIDRSQGGSIFSIICLQR